METKTMCKSTDVLSAKRFAHSTMPTLASVNGSAKGRIVSAYAGSVEIVRERFAGAGADAPFSTTDVAFSAAGRSPI